MSGYKPITVIIAMFISIGLVSCNQIVNESETIKMNDLLYKIGEDQPFTGTVVGKGREDYRRVAYEYKKEYKDGVQDGETVFIYPNGKLESKVPYKNGKVHGFMMRFWPNGRPRARIHFIDGLRGGLRGEMFWDENGHQVKG